MPHATRPGDVLGDRYRLVDLLTESDGGRFWRAHDRILERHVAVHVIGADDERAPALMEAARQSATVHERRVLRVLDAEVTDEVCYVVNEWGWGTSLDILVANTGALGPRRAAWVVAEVADAVAVAHASGVPHGRLNPENVLVDRAGGIRIIGLCVDAALHGVPVTTTARAVARDVDDLAGLLYCAVTTKWAGTSGSAVPGAPRVHGEVLRPRQVRAGIPRPLDVLCEEVLHGPSSTAEVERTARGIEEYLAAFVGDPTGMPQALLSSTPAILPDEEQVVLPPVPELRPFLADEPPAVTRTQTSPSVTAATDRPDHADHQEAPKAPEERPTEAGVPIFGDDDDVSWLERRTTPAPPPPPFDEPPERPLFAPEPPDGAPVRRARPGRQRHGSTGPPTPSGGTPVGSGRSSGGFWPWDTGTGTGTGTGAPLTGAAPLATVDEGPVPGRTFLRLALVLAAVVITVVAVLVAINLGRGKTVLGNDPEPAPSSSADASRTPGARVADDAPLTGLTATGFDPQGSGDDDGAENDSTAPAALDGDPATSWSTLGYNDQLGPPPGLKTGVGLVVDLGGERAVGSVELTFVGAPTAVAVYLADGRPENLEGLEPRAAGTAEQPADRPVLRLPLEGARGTHLVVWLTALPQGDDGRFRGSIAELVVRGE